MGRTTSQPPQPKLFNRRKTSTKPGTQDAHTKVLLTSSSLIVPIISSIVDASPINVEKQPHSFSIPPPTLQSLISSEIVLIDN